MSLVRTSSVLRVVDVEDDIVTFDRDDVEGVRDIGLAVDGDTWLDLGAPDEVTVTIEPGNTLN